MDLIKGSIGNYQRKRKERCKDSRVEGRIVLFVKWKNSKI